MLAGAAQPSGMLAITDMNRVCVRTGTSGPSLWLRALELTATLVDLGSSSRLRWAVQNERLGPFQQQQQQQLWAVPKLTTKSPLREHSRANSR
jgi:hypothetical protein